ncbi:MAG: hypothetical protein SFU56_21765 [Capsulimonadales bacterium]|nr:hypothetical protein [Capsulimonadales bacterium]
MQRKIRGAVFGGLVVLLATAFAIPLSAQPGFAQRQAVAAPRSTVRVVRVRLVPIRLASGDRRQMVLIDWKNNGKRPVSRVNVNILPYGTSRTPLKSMVFDYTIFSSGVANAVRPGRIYRETRSNGFLLSPVFGRARRVEVRVVGVKTL